MTLSDRIENLIGSYPYGTRMEEALNTACRLVIGEMPEALLMSFAVEETDDGTTGVDVTNKRIVKAHKSGYPATRIDETTRARLITETTGRPGFYVLANTAYVVPGGGTIVTVSFPAVSRKASTITGFPTMLTDLVVERAALLLIDNMMVDVRDGFGTAVTLPTAPSAPAAPAISYSAASAAAVTPVSIAALPTAPVYTPPTLATKPSVPTVGTLDLTLKVDGVTALTPPVAPSAPSFAFSDAVAATVGTITIGALPTPPTYTPASFGGSLALPTLPTLDLSTEDDGVTALAPPTPPSAPSIAFVDATAATVAATTLAALGTAPAYTKYAGSVIDLTEYTTYEGEEDPEMMAGIVSRINAQISDKQVAISDELNEYRKEYDAYETDARHKIEQARTTMQEALANARMSTDVSVQNEIRTMEAAVADYDRELARFDRQLVQYRAEVERQVQTFTLSLEKAMAPWREQQRAYLEKYARDIQAAGDEYSGAMQDHLREADRLIEQARIDAQRVAQQAQLTTDVAVQNELQTIRTTIEEYANELQLHVLKQKLYEMEIQAVIQKYSIVLDRNIRVFEAEGALDTQRYSVQVANARAAFDQSLSVYQSGIERNALQAQITRQEAQQTAAQATEIAVVNAAKAMEALATDYQMVLRKHENDMANYKAQVDSALNKQRTLTESVSAKLRMMNFDRQRQEERYRRSFSSFMRAHWPQRTFTVQQPVI